jgi:hypothetical protein
MNHSVKHSSVKLSIGLLVPLLMWACSATETDNALTGGTAQGGSTSSGGGQGGDNPTLSTGTGGNTGCENSCSSDLHQILDCNGVVVQECPPDQGCGESGCVPACQSAAENKSTIGCDYYSVTPDVISVVSGACYAAVVANTWGSPVTLSVEFAGQTYDVTPFARVPSGSGLSLTYAPLPNGEIPAGEVAILFLARFGSALTDCPAGITPALTSQNASTLGTGLGNAFHITASRPVVAYDIFPFGGGQSAAASATLLLPTTAWDTNYIAVNAFEKSQAVSQAQPSLDIVAMEDNTQVTINPIVPIVGGGGVAAAAQNTPTSYTLNRGQVLQFTQDQELTGSPIQSDKPIGVWGAATCLSVGVTAVACDAAHQQIPPVQALGSEYAAVRYRNRFPNIEETPPWRMVGAVDGTTLTWEPAAPPGAPTTLALGQLVTFSAAGPFVVRSQDDDHPFYMSAHMTGCGELGNFSDCRGDPEFVNIIPPAQYMDSYTFFTDPTYPETNLVLVRTRGVNGFADVQLDCAGTISGWQPMGTSGDLEYTHVDLVTGNFMSVNGCDNGRHEIFSDEPFGLTVWGWGSAVTGGSFGNTGGFYSQAVSYAYPAGARVQPINTVVVPPTPK